MRSGKEHIDFSCTIDEQPVMGAGAGAGRYALSFVRLPGFCHHLS